MAFLPTPPRLIDRLDLPICQNCDGEGGWVKPPAQLMLEPEDWEICQSCNGGGRLDRAKKEIDGR